MGKKEEFLKTYSEKQTIFPQAKVFQPFGLGAKDGHIFLSTGTYYRREKIFYYDTYSPFDFEQVELLEDQNIILLKSLEFEFTVRVYFVSCPTITESFWNSLNSRKNLLQKTLLCKSGKILDRLQPFTAYVELYTEKDSSLLFQLASSDTQSYSDEFMNNFHVINCLDSKDSTERLLDIQKKESIVYMNSFSCHKYDALEDKNLYFFSYNALF